jgi:hypothetical protein
MAISIKPGSAKITITARPQVNPPVVSGSNIMSYTGTPIQATGEVTLLGSPGDSAAGWSVGFVQVQWIETNWCFYRGQTVNDGSIFIQRARPPARPNQACCDCVDGSPPSKLFYSTIPAHGELATGTPGAAFPLKLTVSHFDQPADSVNLVETNSSPASGGSKPNFLAESQMEFHFCTILSVREPSGKFNHLQFFYWNVHWQAEFQPTNFTTPPAGFRIKVLPAGSSAHVGPVTGGVPNDRRFVGILNSIPSQSCNQVATAEVRGPNRHEAPVWKNFDVRLP